MKEIIGNISEGKTTIIKDLNDKKIALENLAKIIHVKENEEFYNRLIIDYQNIFSQYQKCWNDISKDFNLDNKTIYNLDFETGDIYIILS